MLKTAFTRLIESSTSGRLLRAAAVFLGLYSLALTLSPAVRDRAFTGLAGLRWMHWLGLLAWLAAFYWMQRQLRRHLPDSDNLILPLAALLSGWGLMTIWRLTTVFGLRQSLWVLICAALFVFALRFKDRLLPILRHYKYLWLLAGFVLTALTFFFGTNPSGIGPDLWLGCCGVYFQPSEPLKLLLIIYLAAYLADRQPLLKGLLPLLAPTVVMTGAALLLLYVQRDLGTAWVFIFIYTTLIYIATGQRRILLLSLLSIAFALFIGYEIFPLIHARVEAWLNPWVDPSGRSYQIVQALLAVAAGGIFGRGPGMGSPGFVPVSHSDFIYTSIVEEAGLLGAVALLLLVGLFVLRSLRIALQAGNAYMRYLAVGLSAYLAAQSLLIIGGNIRMLPLTGVTLPFVSYGGSSLLTSFFALLLLAVISHQSASQTVSSPDPGPILNLSGGFLALFTIAALVTGWWGFVRGPDLLTRTDNARRALSDRYVPRGALLASGGQTLSETDGLAGEYNRSYLYPQLAPVLGYSHPGFGQAGLEHSLDPILRGEEFQAIQTLWINHLLYGQPAPGLDVRLSLDLDLNLEAARLLDGQAGATIVMDPISGEVLVMASSPGYDQARLDATWEELVSSEPSPLINRAVLGAYPPGPVFAPLIYARASNSGRLPQEVGDLEYLLGEKTLTCLHQTLPDAGWEELIANACPGPISQMGLTLGGDALLQLYRELGLYSPPQLRLDAYSQAAPANISRPGLAAIGQSGLLVSPMQVAIASSSLSNFGYISAPQIAVEVEDSGGDWQELEALSEAQPVLNATFSTSGAQSLRAANLPLWQYSVFAYTEDGATYSWYVAGTLPGENGEAARVIVVLLESDNRALAQSIGQALYLSSIEE